MTLNIINSSVYKRVIDRTNIYNSIYALESYIFEKGLLSSEDLNTLTNYQTNIISNTLIKLLINAR